MSHKASSASIGEIGGTSCAIKRKCRTYRTRLPCKLCMGQLVRPISRVERASRLLHVADTTAVSDDFFGDEIAECGDPLGLAQLFGIGKENRDFA